MTRTQRLGRWPPSQSGRSKGHGSRLESPGEPTLYTPVIWHSNRKSTIWRCIFYLKWWISHCYVSLPEGKRINIINQWTKHQTPNVQHLLSSQNVWFEQESNVPKTISLVVSTQLKNIRQNGKLPEIGVKINNIWVATTYIAIFC